MGYSDRELDSIELTNDALIKQSYQRILPCCLKEGKQHLQNLIDKQIIQPSSSPWAALVMIAWKKNGKIPLWWIIELWTLQDESLHISFTQDQGHYRFVGRWHPRYILVYAKSFEHHLERFKKVLQCLKTLGLKVNPAKCQICKRKIEILEY